MQKASDLPRDKVMHFVSREEGFKTLSMLQQRMSHLKFKHFKIDSQAIYESVLSEKHFSYSKVLRKTGTCLASIDSRIIFLREQLAFFAHSSFLKSCINLKVLNLSTMDLESSAQICFYASKLKNLEEIYLNFDFSEIDYMHIKRLKYYVRRIKSLKVLELAFITPVEQFGFSLDIIADLLKSSASKVNLTFFICDPNDDSVEIKFQKVSEIIQSLKGNAKKIFSLRLIGSNIFGSLQEEALPIIRQHLYLLPNFLEIISPFLKCLYIDSRFWTIIFPEWAIILQNLNTIKVLLDSKDAYQIFTKMLVQSSPENLSLVSDSSANPFNFALQDAAFLKLKSLQLELNVNTANFKLTDENFKGWETLAFLDVSITSKKFEKGVYSQLLNLIRCSLHLKKIKIVYKTSGFPITATRDMVHLVLSLKSLKHIHLEYIGDFENGDHENLLNSIFSVELANNDMESLILSFKELRMPPFSFQLLFEKVIKQLPKLRVLKVRFPCQIRSEVKDDLIKYMKTKTVRNDHYELLLRSHLLLILHDSKTETKYQQPSFISLFNGDLLIWTDKIEEEIPTFDRYN